MPQAPPRDADGNTVPHNHPEIVDDAHVIRHILPTELAPDGHGGKRVSSGAYTESSDAHGGMSVDIEQWMAADGLPPLHYVRDDTHGAVRISVGDLRALGLMVGWDPQPENPHHGGVWGLSNSSKRRKVKDRALTIRKAQGES